MISQMASWHVIHTTYHNCSAAAPTGEGELVAFLAGFSRDYAPNMILGQEFLQATIETVLHPTLIMPFTRVSLMAANMSSPVNKVVDGIARLVTKTDVERLKSTKLRSDVEKLEAFLNKQWTTIKAGSHPKRVFYKVFGKVAIRAVLLTLKKEKQGSEGKEYKSLGDIEVQMHEDLKGVSQQIVPASSNEEKKDTAMIGLVDAAKPMFNVISSLKLKLGQAVVYKEQPEKVWKIIKLDDAGMELEYISMLEPAHTIKLHLKPEEIKGSVRIVKDNRLPKLMDTQVAEALFANITCTMEIQRAELFNVLMDAYNNHDTDTNHVMFQEQPDKFMYAYKTLRLRIWCSSLSQTGSATLLRLSPRALMLLWRIFLPPKQVKKAEDGTYSGTLAPFWLLISMKPTDEGKMQLSTIKMKQFTIQVIQNANPLLAHDLIAMKEDEKAKAKKRKTQ